MRQYAEIRISAARLQGALIDDDGVDAIRPAQPDAQQQAEDALLAAAAARVAADEALSLGNAEEAVTHLEQALEHVLAAMELAGDDQPATSSGDFAALTPRQLEVVCLVARGLTNDEIAAELVISPRTAQSHVASALRKTETRSRTELAALAIREGVGDG